jgi:SAM-dependent methyltransferase
MWSESEWTERTKELRARTDLLWSESRDQQEGAGQGFGEPTDASLQRLFDAVQKHAPQAHTFLDVGSGFGRVVFYAHFVRGFQARGIEISRIRHLVAQKFAQKFSFPAERLVRGDALDENVCADIIYSYDYLFGDLSLDLAPRYAQCQPQLLVVTARYAKAYSAHFQIIDRVTINMRGGETHVFALMVPITEKTKKRTVSFAPTVSSASSSSSSSSSP